MRDTTLCFLVETMDSKVTSVLLALKKRGFGINWYNGVGGKVNELESIEEATVRESFEEISVAINPLDLKKVALITFKFVDKPEWDQIMHVYFVEEWSGEPVESEEMKPEWFSVESIPFDKMWPDDKFWLPLVLQGKKVEASFSLDKNNNIVDMNVKEVKIIV